MGALVRFIAEAANAEDETFTSRGDRLIRMDRQKHSHVETLLTTQRELSLQKENVQLLGLDHPLVASYLKKYRELPPEEIGVCVESPDGTAGVLAAWAVEARGDKGQMQTNGDRVSGRFGGKATCRVGATTRNALEVAGIHSTNEPTRPATGAPPKPLGADAST